MEDLLVYIMGFTKYLPPKSMLIFGAGLVLLFPLIYTGCYSLLAFFVKLPSRDARRALLRSGGIQKKKKITLTEELAFIIAPGIRLNEFGQKRLLTELEAAGIPATPQMFMAKTLARSLLCAGAGILCIPLFPPLSFALAIAAIFLYVYGRGVPQRMSRTKKALIETELHSFCSNITETLKSSHDIPVMLSNYIRYNPDTTLAAQLTVTVADMTTGDFERALIRLEGRVGSAMLSEICRGLIAVIRGDDGVAYFQMLTHDLKQIELQRLRKIAQKRPKAIRKAAFLMMVGALVLMLGTVMYNAVTSAMEIFSM